jgi:hypothetical protein
MRVDVQLRVVGDAGEVICDDANVLSIDKRHDWLGTIGLSLKARRFWPAFSSTSSRLRLPPLPPVVDAAHIVVANTRLPPKALPIMPGMTIENSAMRCSTD